MRYKKIVVSVILVSLPCIIFEALLPVYTERLGFTTLQLTILFSVFSLSELIMRIFMGRASDRYSRRTVLFTSLLLYGLAYLTLSGAVKLQYLLLARILQGAAGILLTISVVSLIRSENVNFAQGLGRFGSNRYLGGLLGMGLSFYIFYRYDFLKGWKLLFLCCTGAAVLSFLYCLSVKESSESVYMPLSGSVTYSKEKQKIWFLNLFICTLIRMAGVIVIPYLQDAYGATMEQIAIAFLLPMFISSFLGPYMGRIGDLLGYRKTILGASLIAAVMAAFIAVSPGFIVFAVIWTVYDCSISALNCSLDAMFVKEIPENAMGDFYGKYSFGSNIGRIIGPVLGGVLFQLWGRNLPYITFSVMTVLFCFLTFILLPKDGWKEVYS